MDRHRKEARALVERFVSERKMAERGDDYAFADLPQDLTKMSAAQQERVIAHMAKWPLKKLRKHQDLADAQLKLAQRKRDDLAVRNLQIRQDLLTHAIMQREFD